MQRISNTFQIFGLFLKATLQIIFLSFDKFAEILMVLLSGQYVGVASVTIVYSLKNDVFNKEFLLPVQLSRLL